MPRVSSSRRRSAEVGDRHSARGRDHRDYHRATTIASPGVAAAGSSPPASRGAWGSLAAHVRRDRRLSDDPRGSAAAACPEQRRSSVPVMSGVGDGAKRKGSPQDGNSRENDDDIDDDSDKDDEDRKLKNLFMASLTINSIGGGNRRGRNTLALATQDKSIGGAMVGAIGRGEVGDAGAVAGLRAMDALLGEGGGAAGSSRRMSLGDTLMIPLGDSDGEGESGKTRAKSAGDIADDGGVESPKPTPIAAKKRTEGADEGGSGPAAGREGSARGREPPKRTASGRRLSNDDIARSLRSLGQIELEDLVPTRRISRENSARSSGGLGISESLDTKISDKIEPVVNSVGSPREAIEVMSEGSTGLRRGAEDHWKGCEPRLELGQVNSVSGRGEADGEAERETEVDDSGGGAMLCLESKASSDPKSLPLKAVSRASSSTTMDSFATAHSREPSPSLSRSGDAIKEEASESSLGDPCPRSQFVLMKSQPKSNSGGTGKTQATSSSTLISSTQSISESNNNAASESNPKNKKSNFEAIREEEKELRNSKNSKISSGDQESRSSLVAQDADNFDSNVAPGYGMYKRRKSNRLKRLRRGLANSLKGRGTRKNENRGNTIATEGEGRADREYLNMEGGSQGGSTISAEQQERVSRHLQRKGSNRSVTSAFSSFSAFTGNSDASSNASGRLWSRFKLKKSRPKITKARSLYDVGGSEDHSTRRTMINARYDSALSNVSNLSDDERSGFSRGSALTTGSGFSDFYDHGDHARAVSSLMSSKAAPRATSSGRPLGTVLATVREPASEGGHNGSSGGISAEQKHDEDYHHRRESEMSAFHQYQESRSNDSSDTMNSFYRHPSHEHTLVHVRPNQLFPDSPGWQCDECCKETFDLNIWAYVSTEQNYLLCESCFKNRGYSVTG